MSKSMTFVASAALLLAAAAQANAQQHVQQNVRQLVLAPGKAVSFYLGSKHGITHFEPEVGGCRMIVAMAEKPAKSGMPESSPARIVMSVVPGRPAHIDTAEGQVLVFACNADGKTMTLTMPQDFKFTDGK